MYGKQIVNKGEQEGVSPPILPVNFSQLCSTSVNSERRVLANILQTHGGLIRSYVSTLVGSAGRLVISLLYFISLSNSLSISDFGLFAAASAVGVVLSRIVSFGFVSPLYRVATVKQRMLGTYYTGYLLAAALSLPVLIIAAWLIYQLFFLTQISPATFALIIISEALLWRTLEVVVIVNNGLGQFGRAAILVVSGTILRALAALAFALTTRHGLEQWAWLYAAANLLALALGLTVYLPRRRLRFHRQLYMRRIRDSLSTASAEILFYVQMELDKLAVLAIGGAELAGVYAIVMRLADLTAVPIRSFNMLLVQKLMKSPQRLGSIKTRVMIEALIFAVSLAGIIFFGLVLWFYPNALGKNVAIIASLLIFAWAIPGFRNIVEYHAELLYARGQTGIRMLNLAMLAAMKVLLLAFVLVGGPETKTWIIQLNTAFAILWAASALLTYSAMRLPAKKS
jgi:O-antigen/teichoic acid export membrane protein